MYLSLIIGTNAVISRLRYRETLKVTVSLGNKADVTVLRAFPRFGHPHSQNPSDMGIPFL